MLENKNGESNLSLNQEKEYQENVPVYTMQKDLQNIGIPEYKNNSTQPIPAGTASTSPEKQKSSPFLSPNQSKAMENTTGSSPTKKETNWKKLILISLFVFFLLACGAGGYYFWITKQSTQNQVAPQAPTVSPEETLSLSIEKPNYLPLDIENSDSTKIKETITKYADKVSASGALTPVEFIVTDTKNNPIGFETFATKVGITFLPDLISSLNSENKFSLFIYNDNGKTRFGLVVDSKDSYKLKTALLQEELTFPKDMAPLLQNVPLDLANKAFGSGSYANTEVRYINLTSQNDLSIDYAIFQNKLVMGTTKMTIQSVMDYINSHSEASNLQTTIP
jgi:hypothetical protein